MTMDKALIVGLLRHALQLGAGALVARGLIEQSMVEQLVGAVLTLGTAASYVVGRIRAR
jgi:hypothetical protein